MRTVARCLALLAVLTGSSVPADAQVFTVQERGWIGISVEVRTMVEGNREVTTVVITDVGSHSPASEAGVRAGDVLLSLNGVEWGPDFGLLTESLRPGDPVAIRVARGGNRSTIRFQAGTRSAEPVLATGWSLTVRADTMVERMYRAMDSLRLRLAGETGPAGLRMLTGLTDSLRALVMADAPLHARLPEIERLEAAVLPLDEDDNLFVITDEVRPPFSFYVFGDGEDSLRIRMQVLNREMRRLRGQESERLQELARHLDRGQRRVDTRDPQLVTIRRKIEETDRRASALHSAMARATWEGAGTTVVRSPQRVRPAPNVQAAAELGPLTPYLLGQNRALGAEVVELRSELAEYFDVDGGVLIVDVPAGTPAAAAGIQPGDVVIKVGANTVRSIQQMRFALGRGADELPVTLIRKGTQVQVLFHR